MPLPILVGTFLRIGDKGRSDSDGRIAQLGNSPDTRLRAEYPKNLPADWDRSQLFASDVGVGHESRTKPRKKEFTKLQILGDAEHAVTLFPHGSTLFRRMRQLDDRGTATTLQGMAHPRHNLHIALTVAGLLLGGILAVVTGGDAFALALATGGTTGIGYWFGAMAHRKHG